MDGKVNSAGVPSGYEKPSRIPFSDEPRAGDSPKHPGWRWLIAGVVLFVLALPTLVHSFRGNRESVSTNSLQLSYQKFQERKYQESINAAREYLKTHPGSADAWNNTAVSDLMLGRYDEAIRDVTTALHLDPANQLAKNNLRWIIDERAKAKGGNVPPPPPVALSRAAPLLNLSLQQYNSGQFAACVESAKAAIKMEPKYAEAYNNLAACQSASGHYDAAIDAAREALRLKPDFQLARNNLNWAMKERAGK